MHARIFHIALALVASLLYLGARISPCIDSCAEPPACKAVVAECGSEFMGPHAGESDHTDRHADDGDHDCDCCFCPCHVPVVLTHEEAAVDAPDDDATYINRHFRLPASAVIDPVDPVPLA